MSLTFDPDFHTPFNESDTLAGSDAPYQFGVAIEGHAYLVDLVNYRRRTIPALREPVDQSKEPGEQSLNTQGMWSRAQWDWRDGAGQTYFDIEGSSRLRFFESKGIDPWTERIAQLLPTTELKKAGSGTNQKFFQVNGYGYYVDGSHVYFSNSLTPSSPTFSDANFGATVTGITTDGISIWVATGGALKKATVGATAVSTIGALTPDYVAYCNGRLIIMDGPVITEVDSSGVAVASSLAYTHKVASFVWQGAIGTPSGIYAWGKANDLAEIYYIGVDEDTGALTVPLYAGGLPIGETLNTLGFYERAVVFATTKGLRVAIQPEQGFSLDHGPLTEIPGGVNGLDPRGQYVWFTWANYDTTSTGLGRIDLSRFTETLVPAYASDLMATAQGTVQGVGTLADRRYFAVSGAGLYGETANKVTEGTFRTGKILFGTFIPKVPSSLDLRCVELPAGAEIEVEAAGDDETFATILNLSREGATEPLARVALDLDNSEEMELRFTLSRATSTTTGPELKRWTLQALAAPSRTDEFIVPLIIYSSTEAFTDQPQQYDVLEEFLFLKALEASGEIVTYKEGTRSYQVYVDTVEVQPHDWTDERGFFDGIIVVRLLSIAEIT